jgi:hypothetical protein
MSNISLRLAAVIAAATASVGMLLSQPPSAFANDYGPDTCQQGFVWREAVPGDHVCVTPETRTQAWGDNDQASARRNPGGGAYGPDTCYEGFVWREAVPSDHVCVTPQTRGEAWSDDAQAASRVAPSIPSNPAATPDYRTLTAEGHADVDDGGIEDLYFPTDNSENHDNLLLAVGGDNDPALTLVDGPAPGESSEILKARCEAAVNRASTASSRFDYITLSDVPADQSAPHGHPGSWVCVRTSEGSMVLLTIQTVHPAIDTEGRDQEVVIAIKDVWH